MRGAWKGILKTKINDNRKPSEVLDFGSSQEFGTQNLQGKQSGAL